MANRTFLYPGRWDPFAFDTAPTGRFRRWRAGRSFICKVIAYGANGREWRPPSSFICRNASSRRPLDLQGISLDRTSQINN